MAVFDPDLQPSSDRGHLLTEQSNRRSSRLDQLDTLALVELVCRRGSSPPGGCCRCGSAASPGG